MTFTVLTCEFMHESNTFSRYRTDLPQFQVDTLLYGDEAIRARRDANTELAGFMDVAEPAGWNVIHAISAHAVPGGQVTKQPMITSQALFWRRRVRTRAGSMECYLVFTARWCPSFARTGRVICWAFCGPSLGRTFL